jgi:hypothetical protein
MDFKTMLNTKVVSDELGESFHLETEDGKIIGFGFFDTDRKNESVSVETLFEEHLKKIKR